MLISRRAKSANTLLIPVYLFVDYCVCSPMTRLFVDCLCSPMTRVESTD